MQTYDKLKPETAQVFQDYLDEVHKNINVDTFRVMKRVLDASFGKENNQIIKLDVKEAARLYAERNGNNFDYIPRGSTKFETRMIKQAIGNSGFIILVKFPEITITNGHKNSRTIRDLYVKLPFDSVGKVTGEMKGTRTTLTKEELQAGYIHSHLPSTSGGEGYGFQHFCLGTGPITQVLSILRTAFDEVNFKLFCLHLKSYVKWESLDGNPHIHMETVAMRSAVLRVAILQGSVLSEIIPFIEEEIMKLPTENIRNLFTYALSDKGVFVSPTEELELYIAKIMQECKIPGNVMRNMETLYAYKDSLGEYYPVISSTGTRRTIPQSSILTFKGEDKTLIISNNPNQIKTEKKYANPSITRELCHKFSREINRTIARIGIPQ